MGVFDELKARGMIAQATDEEKIKELLNNEKVTFYIGFDPTADSLHVGHFLQLMIMSRLQKAGHQPIAIIGGGTAMVGDPTGKSDMRKMLTEDDIRHNAACFVKQMKGLVDFTNGKALMLNNADWLMKLEYIPFLRDIGVHFSVNKMLTATCFKTRLEKGLSFIEFNYMLMQSYDFLKLFRDYNCTMELGGDDQWSNIINGVDLVRRAEGREVFGLTFTLLTTSDGKKMGKTEKGAVWLDPEKTVPYDFFQYWRNIDDSDVIKCMKLLTFMPLEEIAEYEKLEGSGLNSAKERLAFEVTKIIHGEEAASKALMLAKSLFGNNQNAENMPFTILEKSDFTDGEINIVDLLLKTGLMPSRNEARRMVEQGGITLDNEKITDAKANIGSNRFEKGFVIIKKGKKVFHKAMVK